MDYQKYNVTANSNLTIFEFISSGIHGKIEKVIKFSETKNAEIVNLGFGDKVSCNNENFNIDDLKITDNGDRDVVLATIANAVYLFTELYPEKYVFFSGTCEARTRLYRMVISNNIIELNRTFHIFGIIKKVGFEKHEVVPFTLNSKFVGFLIKRK